MYVSICEINMFKPSEKIINSISFYLFLTGPCSGVLVRCRPFQSPIFLLNDDKICEKKTHTSFDRSMIKLREQVVRIIFMD